MIQIYSKGNTNFESNGNITLFPTSCILKTCLNGSWEMTLEHPLDEEGRWKYIEEESVICAPTFVGNRQKFRIRKIEKTDEEIVATAYPIFFDSAKDCFLVDARPEEKDGQQTLNIITEGSKYSGESDIKTISTAYFIRRNLMDAINGEDEPTFIQRWGGEILYDNYKVIINERVGGDYGTEVRYGKNMNGLSYSLDMTDVITRIVPVAYNGYTLPGGRPWVDSPNIGKYAMVYTKEIKFDNVKLSTDAQPEDEEKGIIICESLEEIYEALRQQCEAQFKTSVDLPKVTIEVNMIDLSKTEEYKEYKILEKVGLGDTVHCRHRRLDIITDARVVELGWDCIRNVSESMKLGEFEYDYFKDVSSAINRVNEAIRPDGTVIGQQVQGIIDGVKAQFKAQSSIAKRQNVRAILFEDLNPESDTYGAMCLGTLGFEIASERTADGRDWKWNTFGTGKGFFANFIVAGTMLADRIKGGTLELGGFNNQNGVLIVKDGNGNELGRWNNNGIYATGPITSDNPKDKHSITIENGHCYIRDEKGETSAIISYLNNGITIQTYGGASSSSIHMSRNGKMSIWANTELTLATPKLEVGGGTGKTGTAEFNDGSYLDFRNGILIGGRTTEGGAF